jgi:predicted dehydrogenase
MSKRILVCGAGSIGRRHISNLLLLGAEVSVWRARSDLLFEIAHDFPVRTCLDLAQAIAEAEAVVVATATDQHVEIATEVLKAGRALFIEKPLSHDWIGIDSLRYLAEASVVEVGCQFRAHPNLILLAGLLGQPEYGQTLTYRLAMGHRLDAWRPAQDYQKGYSADSSRGGGALFDLIHQIDIALWFFGPVVAVNAVLAKLGDLNIRGDDVTNLLLTHESGVTGHIQLDMSSPIYRCEAEVITSKVVFRWSNAEGLLRSYSPEYEAVLDRLPLGSGRNNLFLSHMTHFLKRLDSSVLLPPLCTFEDGVAALRVALAARKANSLGKMVKI